MIIISKRKDYYDYLSKVYGRDDKKVLDRTMDVTSDEIFFMEVPNWKKNNIYDLEICGRIYRVEQVNKGEWEFHKFHSKNTDYLGRRRHYRESEVKGLKDFEYYIQKPENLISETPISIKGTYLRKCGLVGFTPILRTFNIPSILPATEIYAEIDMFISHQISLKEQRVCQSNEDKILSKGFDSKTSFRHRK